MTVEDRSMSTLSKQRPEIIGAIHRNSSHRPVSLILGFRDCNRNLQKLIKVLENSFDTHSRIVSGIPGHEYRQFYRRKDNAKNIRRSYPEAISSSKVTTATLDVWTDPEVAERIAYLTSVPLLHEYVREWGYGDHATLCVTTCTELVLPGEHFPVVDYRYSLEPSVLRLLRDKFVPSSHIEHTNNGYVLLWQPHS